MCVAILHDVIEDCGEKYETEIIREFYDYPEITAAIYAISKKWGEPLGDYYARAMENPMAHRVKLADMEHNMSYDRIICIADPATRARLTAKYNKGYTILTKVV